MSDNKPAGWPGATGWSGASGAGGHNGGGRPMPRRGGWQNLAVGKQILFSFIAVSLVMVLLGGAGFWAMGQMNSQASIIAQVSTPKEKALTTLRADSLRVTNDITSATIENSRANAQNDLNAATTDLEQMLASLSTYQSLPHTADETAALGALQATLSPWQATYQTLVPLLQTGTPESIAQALTILRQQWLPQRTAMSSAIDTLVASAYAQTTSTTSQLQTSFTQGAVFLLVILLVGVALALGLAMFLARGLTSPLVALVEEARRVADGEVTNTAELAERFSSESEIGQLVASFDLMSRNLSELVAASETLAAGELTPIDEVVARYAGDEKKGILAKSLNKIIHRQVEYVEFAHRIGDGELLDLHHLLARYEGKPHSGMLAKALVKMADNINEMVESANHLADGELVPIDALEARYKANEKQGILIRSLNKIIHRQVEYTQIAQRVGDGDLVDMSAIIARYEGRPNAGVLAKSLHHMIESLRDLVSHITETASSLSVAAGQIAETAEQTGNATEQVTQTIQQVAAGVQEQAGQLTSIAAEMSRLKQMGDDGAQASIDTGRMARSSGEVISETLASMDSVRSNVSDGAEKVRRLAEQSQQISAITTSISDIADQTNLLALNAAIEAARAGEHGRGFSVVADEVRKLAERSSSSTQEIAKIINEVQEQIRSTLETMENGVKNVASVTERSRDAELAFKKIMTAMDEAVDRSRATADSTERASAAVTGVASVSEENSAGAEEVSAAAEEMAAQVEETVAATQQLHQLTQELREAVSVFHMEGGEPEVVQRRREIDWVPPTQRGPAKGKRQAA